MQRAERGICEGRSSCPYDRGLSGAPVSAIEVAVFTLSRTK